MKSLFIYLLPLCILLIQTSCTKELKQNENHHNLEHLNLKSEEGEDDDIPIIIRLSGQVKNDNNTYLSNVDVSLSSITSSYETETTTNQNGYFQFDSIPKDSLLIHFSKLSYQDLEVNIDLLSYSGEIYLLSEQVMLDQ